MACPEIVAPLLVSPSKGENAATADCGEALRTRFTLSLAFNREVNALLLLLASDCAC